MVDGRSTPSSSSSELPLQRESIPHQKQFVAFVVLQVLAADPKNAKAIFRRGKAELRLGNTDAAARDLEAAHKLAPEDAAISRETRELKRQLQQDRAAQAELFRGRLPSASPPPLLPPFSVAETNKPVLWRGIAQLLQFLQTVVGWFLPSVMVQQYKRPHGE